MALAVACPSDSNTFMILDFFLQVQTLLESACVYSSPSRPRVVRRNSAPLAFTDAPLTPFLYFPGCPSGFSAEYPSLPHIYVLCTKTMQCPSGSHAMLCTQQENVVCVSKPLFWSHQIISGHLAEISSCRENASEDRYRVPIPLFQTASATIIQASSVFIFKYIPYASSQEVHERNLCASHNLWFSHRLTGSDIPENFLLCYFQNIS